jgi:hypothetical protein
MKKILIIALMGLFSSSSQCSILHFLFGNNYCSYSSTTTTTINGHTTTTTTTSNTQNKVTGSGKAKTKKVPLKNINKVSASGTGSLLITQCEDPKNCIESLEITADDNILEYFYGTMNDDTLELGQKNNGSFNPIIPIKYHLTVRDIISIQSSGTTKIESASISTKRLTIDSQSSSPINIKNIESDELTVNANGSGSIKVSGKVDNQTIKITGSGKYDADQLISQEAIIDLNGSAALYLSVINRITGKSYGSESITLNKKYNPKKEVKIFGSAKIR